MASRTILRFVAVVASAALSLALRPSPALAGLPENGVAPQHGGTLAQTERHRFEVVFEPGGLRVYPVGDDLAPGAVAGLKGRAYVLLPGASQYSAPIELRPVATAPEGPPDALAAEADLAALPAEGTRVTLQVWKLPDPAETTAQFTLPLVIASPAPIIAVEATEEDRLAVFAQETCPVSGADLKAMGGPIRVTRGDSDRLYLCCRGCLPKVEEAPDRSFSAVLTASGATKADVEAVAAQGTCPISGESLDSMGGPIKLARAGRSVFVCCAGCIPAVKADVDTYLGADPGKAPEPVEHDEHDHGPNG
ncbi:hypothetical protein [Tautonia sociabilis]|uniref:YHS domain protein n=1 Tax=Tautonia sociabilis TaxID=2080755 RepID=A0A432MFK5_9BACT|nr:hypothetical protein [Tautonia sociabilis]RUL84685.1 hypothetical protein TsocGM_19890 [Tautonia sociabilis]